MKLIARCHPGLKDLLPPPVPAGRALPGWFKGMPSQVESETLGAPIRTLKHCLPMIDAMSAGVIVRLPTDIIVSDDGFAWDWPYPALSDNLQPPGPIGAHLPEQAQGAPFATGERLIVKFTNYWTFEAPEGWDLLYTHPLNHEDQPFRCLSGRVDAHGFRHGFVNFPALWHDHSFRGTLERGTPVAQVIPVPREVELDVTTHEPDDIAQVLQVHDALKADRGAYRKHYRD